MLVTVLDKCKALLLQLSFQTQPFLLKKLLQLHLPLFQAPLLRQQTLLLLQRGSC